MDIVDKKVMLSAVAAAGVSADYPNRHIYHTMQYFTTGAPAGVTIQAEGSLDGSHWNVIGSAMTNTNGGMVAFTGYYPHLVVNLVSLTGGTAPTVTAMLAGRD